MPDEDRPSKALEMLEADFRRLFDLGRDILIRPVLIQLAEEAYLFQITMHHIITDGWSMDIFFQELSRLYQAKISDKTSHQPELSIQYSDFAIRQRQQLSGKKLDDLLAYWEKQLANPAVLLQLPADRPRPSLQTYKGSRVHFSVPKELNSKIRNLAIQHNVTPFMLMNAALNVLLYRYSGQEDILVGVPIANRTAADIEKLIGFFVNTLVLRTNLSGSPTFLEVFKTGQARRTRGVPTPGSTFRKTGRSVKPNPHPQPLANIPGFSGVSHRPGEAVGNDWRRGQSVRNRTRNFPFRLDRVLDERGGRAQRVVGI